MTVRISGTPGDSARTAGTPSAWGALGACLVAVFMQMLDLTIVHTAMPAVARALRADAAEQLLIVTGYGLAFACTLLTAARLGDLFGRRTVFLTAIGAFAAASLWCGIASGAAELVAARAVAGVAAAAASAQTIAIITGAFPERGRGAAFGVYGAVAGLAGLAGPLAGGALVDANALGVGWRAIFLVNVPLCALAIALGRRYVAEGPPGERPRPVTARELDLAGVLLSATGLAALVFPLTAGRELGWPPALWVLLGSSVPLLTVFVRRQRRQARGGGDPLVRPELFADRDFAIGAMLMAVFYGMFTALLFTVSVTVQSGLSWSASRTGLLMLPFAIGAVAAALSSPILLSLWGSRALTVGVTVFAVALGAAATIIDTTGSAVDIGALAWPVFTAGAGMGWFAAPLPSVMLRGVADRVTGSASGIVPAVQQIGSAVGVAVLGMVFFDRVSQRSYLEAITTVLWTMAAVSTGLALLTFALPRRRS
ncbi:MFS transporter [Nocardia tengchongensis]